MKNRKAGLILGFASAGVIIEKVSVIIACKNKYKADAMIAVPNRNMGFYEKYVKRCLDIVCAVSAILIFWPLYMVIALLVQVRLGSPVLFVQDRPGLIDADGKETIFRMYKFRTMTDERNGVGELLSDEKRLTRFGTWLRSTSLDELPEVINVLNGTMSIIGPRPQLVRDMVFMTPEQRMRHTAKPGLSGLAQVNGRNAISWEQKLFWDLRYIENISLINDIKILAKTVEKAIIKKEGITGGNMATAEDLGDYLLRTGKISNKRYEEGKNEEKKILRNRN